MRNNFRGKKILVTGCAGFIGSHVTDALINLGAIVYGIDDLNTGSYENIKHLLNNPNFRFTRGDICSKETISNLVEKVEYVYHAAVRGIGLSTKNPYLDLKVNIEGTLLLLELLRNTGVVRLVFASSASVYGNPKKLPEKENDPTFPLSPYGVSKLAAERYVMAYHSLYNLPVVALRYFNVYGPRQRWDSIYGGVVSIFLNNALRKKPLPIYGSGNQTRDFTYVDDVVQATLLAFTKRGAIGKVINIAAGKQYKVKMLAKIVKKISGQDLKLLHVEKRLIDNVRRRFGDISLARKILDYHPAVNLDMGLKKTFQWWKDLGN